MNVTAGLWALAVLFVLLALRVPIAVALVLVSFGGVWYLLGLTPAIGILSSTPYEFISSWTLSAVPMFLLMGFVIFHAGLTTSLFDAAKVVFRRIPGGLGISAIFACTGFAAVSGSSIACAATMGRIAIPEMVRAGYRPSFSAGILAAGGTIGALIPPSILMIVYGVFAETSAASPWASSRRCPTARWSCWWPPSARTSSRPRRRGWRRSALPPSAAMSSRCCS
jgi:tripartite ATP-independent transporter DctM subunit